MTSRYHHLILALAAVLLWTAARPLWAYDFVTPPLYHHADSLRWLYATDSASVQVTYLSTDPAQNATCYQGTLQHPAVLTWEGRELPVRGYTALAAAGCRRLHEVIMPPSVWTVGYGAFADCDSLSSVQMAYELRDIADVAFYRCGALSRVVVPGTVQRVGAASFAYCASLDSLTFYSGVQAIGARAFYGCRALQRLRLGATIDQVGEYAFAYCTGLTEVIAPGAPLAITDDVFEGVDCESCRLVVDVAQVEAYRQAEVWCRFQIEGRDLSSLDVVRPDVRGDGLAEAGLRVAVDAGQLILDVEGDAPALVYDLQGQRRAVAPSRSGRNVIALPTGRAYVVRCGRAQVKVQL